MAEAKPEVKYIVFRCADGYDVGIPIDRGLLNGSILAYEMNGAALTAEHGFPIRAIIPGLYGMKSKWITEIELVDNFYQGYWQRKGWANNAKYNTHSFIVIPGNVCGKKKIQWSSIIIRFCFGRIRRGVPFGGMAFAGDRAY